MREVRVKCSSRRRNVRGQEKGSGHRCRVREEREEEGHLAKDEEEVGSGKVMVREVRVKCSGRRRNVRGKEKGRGHSCRVREEREGEGRAVAGARRVMALHGIGWRGNVVIFLKVRTRCSR